MIIPTHLPQSGSPVPVQEERPKPAAACPSRGESPTCFSDARDMLIKDKPTDPHLSNHNSGIGNNLTGANAGSPVTRSESAGTSSPLEDANSAAAAVRTATQMFRSQPATALLAQASVALFRVQRTLS